MYSFFCAGIFPKASVKIQKIKYDNSGGGKKQSEFYIVLYVFGFDKICEVEFTYLIAQQERNKRGYVEDDRIKTNKNKYLERFQDFFSPIIIDIAIFHECYLAFQKYIINNIIAYFDEKGK